MKFNKENLKQVFLSVLAIALIGLGYFNYNSGMSNINKNQDILEVSADYNELNLGDVELVNSDIVPNDNLEEVNTNIVSENNDKSDTKTDVIGENNVVNENTNIIKTQENTEVQGDDYFTETRIQRDRMYSEMLEVYQNLVKSEETPVEQKTIAAQEITNITNIKNSIMISENLIKNKGFEDVVILVNSENVNVVVKSSKLNQEEISKIQNIIQRELDVDFSNISITNK